MSPKSAIQLVILIVIFIIIGGVYFKYFSKEKITVDQTSQQTEKEINTNSQDDRKNKNENEYLNSTNKDKLNKKKIKADKIDSEGSKEKKPEKKNTKPNEKQKKDNEIPNIVKDVEYITTDKNGNKYKILATSGRTNQIDKNILDLDNVKGEITSKERSTIYIVSDFAEYNSSTLGSKFYKNVVINYEDKKINCENFDINMDTNIAIAYNNVVVTDPKSTMKAGIIVLNIETKEIDINPDKNGKSKVQINTKKIMAVIKKFRIKSFKERETLVELNKVSMFYNKRQILNNLNLKINRNEVLGMLGPNGVGKSTIFQIITGLKDPSFGKVLINNVDCTNIPIYERTTRFKLGYVPQYGGFIQDLNLIENLKLVAEIHIKEKDLRQTKIEKIVSQFEFESLLKIKAKHLSGGQKKKLVIAMALINDPGILLLDEPFAALDILTIKMLQEIIVNLQSMERITVVVCDHQARDLLSCVDRAIVLSNGKIIASGSPNEIINDTNARSAYFGDEFKIN